jgi:hypothetical protein
MKKNLSKLLFLFALLSALSFAASAQVYVKTRPTIPAEGVRPARPNSTDVWIGEEWKSSGANYQYSGGHWATPPHPGYTRKPGHWKKHNKDGEQWIEGSWKKG